MTYLDKEFHLEGREWKVLMTKWNAKNLKVLDIKITLSKIFLNFWQRMNSECWKEKMNGYLKIG